MSEHAAMGRGTEATAASGDPRGIDEQNRRAEGGCQALRGADALEAADSGGAPEDFRSGLLDLLKARQRHGYVVPTVSETLAPFLRCVPGCGCCESTRFRCLLVDLTWVTLPTRQ